MAPIAKSRKHVKKAKIGSREDRISSLPDSILVHILSFLSTKSVFRTSILSSRWKNLWASVPILVFDDNFGVSNRFMNFVDRVVFFHDSSCIKRFHLKCGEGIDMFRLNAWIRFVIMRNIKELDISIVGVNHLKLPLDLYTCKTLVVLKLGRELLLDVPSAIHFPSLKTLHVSLSLPNNDSTQKLFSSCPVLENLSIAGCVWGYEKLIFNISIPVLKSLKIDLFGEDFDYSESNIVVNAPLLQYLFVRETFLAHYTLSNLSSLVEVYVDIGDRFIEDRFIEDYADDYIEDEGTKQHANRAFTILKEISNAKVFSLGPRAMAVLGYANGFDWPIFPNLTRLELTVHDCYVLEREHLSNLLNSAPNLAILVLETEHSECNEDEDYEGLNRIQPQGGSACLLSHLKEIRVIGFTGSIEELQLIQFLLEKAVVLNEMTLEFPELCIEEEEEKKFLERLSMFPRASTTSQIVIHCIAR